MPQENGSVARVADQLPGALIEINDARDNCHNFFGDG